MYTFMQSHVKIFMQSLKLRFRKDDRQSFSIELTEKARYNTVWAVTLSLKKKKAYIIVKMIISPNVNHEGYLWVVRVNFLF